MYTRPARESVYRDAKRRRVPRERKLYTNHESHVGRILSDAKCIVDTNDDFDVGCAERRRCPARPNLLPGRRRRQRDAQGERDQQAKYQHGRRREVIDAPETAAVLTTHDLPQTTVYVY